MYKRQYLSISGDGLRLAVGAHKNDGQGLSNSGHVRIYDWNGSNWIQIGDDIDGEEINDESGLSVSLSYDGSIVAIGARFNNGDGNSTGHVRVYQWNGTEWIKLGSDIFGEATDDNFGFSVSLSSDGTQLASSAPGNDEAGGGAGHVRICLLYTSPSPRD